MERRIFAFLSASFIVFGVIVLLQTSSDQKSRNEDLQTTSPEDVFLNNLSVFGHPTDAAALRAAKGDLAVLDVAAPAAAATAAPAAAAPAAPAASVATPSSEINAAGSLVSPQAAAASSSTFQSSVVNAPLYQASPSTAITPAAANAVAADTAESTGVSAESMSGASNAQVAGIASTDLNAIQESDRASFLASQQPAAVTEGQPQNVLGHAHGVENLEKYVQRIDSAKRSSAFVQAEMQQCATQEQVVTSAAKNLNAQKASLQAAIKVFNAAAATKALLDVAANQSTIQHNGALQQSSNAAAIAMGLRATYLAAIAQTNAAKVALAQQLSASGSTASAAAQNAVAQAEATESEARQAYSNAVQNRLFAEQRERQAASNVSLVLTQVDAASQQMEQAYAAKLDAVAEVDAADSSLQAARADLFTCYTRMREAANTNEGLRAEALAKAAMSGVSDAAHIHGGGS